MSNELLAEERTIDSLTFGYSGLTDYYGVKLIHEQVAGIDPIQRRVTTLEGTTRPYDRLILAPGISFRWGAIEGYDEAASKIMPHAWFAGEQTLLLRQQLQSLDDGGTVCIVAPPNPFKCPPGPYERAGLIAHYLKRHKKGKAKILILDAKTAFAKQKLFEQAWERLYPGMIEWVPSSDDGLVQAVDVLSRTLYTEFDEHKGDVVNVIPPQMAGVIAVLAGVTDDSGWCPVSPLSFESTLAEGVHVIGDAASAAPMPKSAYSANTQAKVCATAVAALLNGNPPRSPSYVNTCYSLSAPDYGFSVSAVYRLVDGKIVAVKGAGGHSPLDASDWAREKEAGYGRSWFNNITSETFS
jgi:sulfide dehydrogenase [flavocytochrome c] flavoprotein subunit